MYTYACLYIYIYIYVNIYISKFKASASADFKIENSHPRMWIIRYITRRISLRETAIPRHYEGPIVGLLETHRAPQYYRIRQV